MSIGDHEGYIEVGDGKAIKLEKYKGNYSITQHRFYQGKWYWKECKVKLGMNSVAEKFSPMKVELGDVETARAALNKMLDELD